MKKLAIFGLIGAFLLSATPASADVFRLPTKEALARTILENIEEVESLEYEATFSAEYFEGDMSVGRIDLTSQGGYEDEPAHDRSGYFSGQLAVSEEGASVFDGTLHLMETPNYLYFMLETPEEAGTWIYTDKPEAFEEELGTELDEETEEEIRERILDFAENAITITGQERDVIFDGVDTAHFTYELNEDYLLETIVEEGGEYMTDADIADIEAALELIDIHGDIYIEKFSLLPYKVTMHGELDMEEAGYATMNAEIVFTSMNEDIRVSAPGDAEFAGTFEELVNTPGFLPASEDMMDIDRDGLSNLEEASAKTSPLNSDTDGDGYSDGMEMANLYNPVGGGRLDSDLDGLSDYDEIMVWKTNPDVLDTDGDGYPDAMEVWNGYDPLGPGRLK